MGLPVLLLCGKKQSGKDTVADILCRNYNGIKIALAYPLKRLVEVILPETREAMWGESDGRRDQIIQVDWRTARDNLYEEPWELFRGWVNQYKLKVDVNEAFEYLKIGMGELKTQNPEGLKTRQILQHFGTQTTEAIGYPHLWVDMTIQRIAEAIQDFDKSEYQSVIVPDGRFIHDIMAFKRFGAKVALVIDPEQSSKVSDPHKSENQLNSAPSWWFDGTLENNRSLGLGALESTTRFLWNTLFPGSYIYRWHESLEYAHWNQS